MVIATEHVLRVVHRVLTARRRSQASGVVERGGIAWLLDDARVEARVLGGEDPRHRPERVGDGLPGRIVGDHSEAERDRVPGQVSAGAGVRRATREGDAEMAEWKPSQEGEPLP